MDKIFDSLAIKTQNNSLNNENIILRLSQKCINEALNSSNSEECLSQIKILSTNFFIGLDINGSESNKTMSSVINDVRPFMPRWWIQFFWSILFGVMVLASIIGNLVVIWIVLANRTMRTVTNYFLLNLTIADLSIALFNAIFNFVFMLNSHWPFGQIYCVANNFIANLSIPVSVFTISATSIDR